MKKNQQRRSDCPINFALEIFGDMWALLIVRDIVYFGKKTYGEFLASGEGMATNILTSRLVHLEEKDILMKKPYVLDKRKEIYALTDKGLDLIPILLEIADWGMRYDQQTAAPHDWFASVNADKAKMINLIRETVQSGGSVFAGPNSVVRKIASEQ